MLYCCGVYCIPNHPPAPDPLNPIIRSVQTDHLYGWSTDNISLNLTHSGRLIKSPQTRPARPEPTPRVKDTKGRFSDKLVYQANQKSSLNPNMGGLWQRLWRLKLHERSKIFLWRIGTKALPTKEMLANKMEIQDKICYLCGHEEESDTHLFFKWSTARAI